jgi:hypothetical protein
VFNPYFHSQNSFDCCLEATSEIYEESILKGPLKGVNFPIGVYKKWMETAVDLNEGEIWLKRIVDLDCVYLIAS